MIFFSWVLFLHSQLFDFSISLKLDLGSKSLSCLVRLLRVFICLKSAVYEKTVTVGLIQLIYLMSVNHPVFTMFQHNVTVFNEEMGETLISILARHCLSDTIKFDWSHIDQKWKLIHFIRSCLKDFEEDFSLNNHANDSLDISSIKVSPDSPEVARLAVFFRHFIDSVLNNNAKQYRLLDSKSNYGKQSEEIAKSVPCIMQRVLHTVSEQQLQTIIDKAHKSLLNKSYPVHFQDLIDFKTHTDDSIDPLFEDEVDEDNPAVCNQLSECSQREVVAVEVDPETGFVESAIVTMENFQEGASGTESSNQPTAFVPRSSIPRPKPARKRKQISKNPSSQKQSTHPVDSESDSEWLDDSGKCSNRSSENQPLQFPESMQHQSLPNSVPSERSEPIVNNWQVESVCISNSSFRSSLRNNADLTDPSDTESFIEQLNSAPADKFGFVSFGSQVSTSGRRQVMSSVPSCTSCAISFGDNECNFKYCLKCCIKWSKTHRSYECEFHEVNQSNL